MPTELKPCPLCGNKNPVMMTRRGQNGWRDYFYVLCDFNDSGCGASGQWNHYADDAADAWNSRENSFSASDVGRAMVVHGQNDKRFSWGDTIRYSPSEVEELLNQTD